MSTLFLILGSMKLSICREDMIRIKDTKAKPRYNYTLDEFRGDLFLIIRWCFIEKNLLTV